MTLNRPFRLKIKDCESFIESPFIVVSDTIHHVENGILADVAPTVLKIMGIPQPALMTGHSLV